MGKQTVKEIKIALYGISRDGELIGAGMPYEKADQIVSEICLCYPESNFKIIPQPKSGKKVNP